VIPPEIASKIVIDLIDIPFKTELKAQVESYFQQQQQAQMIASQQGQAGG
jgi:hypothetical protein